MSDARKRKRMSIREFQQRGYLFEVNRRFFHPLGLALAIVVPEDRKADKGYRLGWIMDVRDAEDREGIIMGDWDQEQIDNAHRIEAELAAGFDPARKAGLGFVVEPIPDAPVDYDWEGTP